MNKSKNTFENGVFGAFIADSLALGPHWIYDTAEIDKKFPTLDVLSAPGTSYHPGKTKGDQTHIGDQAFLVLKNCMENGGVFDAESFMKSWLEFWQSGTQSYKDHATKDTLENIAAGKPLTQAASSSEELAGVARGLFIAPLYSYLQKSEKEAVDAVMLQASLTHNSELVKETTKYLSEVCYSLSENQTDIQTTIKTVAEKSDSKMIKESFAKATHYAELSMDPRQAIKEIGQSCALPDAFIAVMFLLIINTKDSADILRINALAGGDSSARGLVLGTIIGIANGIDSLPSEWLNDLKLKTEIENLLAKV